MFITACNRFFQKHYRLIFAAILGMIIVPFIFVFGNQGDRDSFTKDAKLDIGKMNGKAINAADFHMQLAAVRLNVLLQMRQHVDINGVYRDILVNMALDRLRTLKKAHEKNIDRFSDADVKKEIESMPMFQKDGKFDPMSFSFFKMSALQPLGLSGSDYDVIVRDNMAIEAIEKLADSNAKKPTAKEVLEKYTFENTKYTVKTCEFKNIDFLPEAATQTADDKVVRDFYTKNVECYRGRLLTGMTPDTIAAQDAAVNPGAAELVTRNLKPFFVPEQKKALVATFSADAAKVTDDQIKALFEKKKEEGEYGPEVKASHILLKLAKDAKPVEKATKQKQLEEIRAKIVAGAKFEDLAKEKSDCPSKDTGGDLGFFGHGQMVKAFEDAAFALKPGELSGIVESPFGLHLIKLMETKAGRTFADAKDELQTSLANTAEDAAKVKAEKAAEQFVDEIYKLQENQPSTGSYAALKKAFVEKAAELKIIITETDFVRADRTMVGKIGNEFGLARQIAALDEQKPFSEMVNSTAKTNAYVACFAGKKAAYLPGIDEVLPQVRGRMNGDIALELARKAAKEKSAALAKNLDGKTEFDKAAADLSMKFTVLPEFSHANPPREAGVSTVFDLMEAKKEGTLFDAVETPSGAVVIYFVSKKAPTPAEFEKEKDSFMKQMEQALKSEEVSKARATLAAEYPVELSEAWRPKTQAPARKR